ncbi:hypothetical protein BDZ85DRAFT_262597 [Elsinoe ampelina]|uniref:Fucose-specific lectin n=1 Tax=Elsinoe ampelina TaxID=302913 RepID=A0A6A6GAZ0_9PEZI|nr:hypothetical protein BDZ85DRAFT_262597 [Elsinoe ampelina]
MLGTYSPVPQRESAPHALDMSTDPTKLAPGSPNEHTLSPRSAMIGPESHPERISSPMSAVSAHSDKQCVPQDREIAAPMLAIDNRDQSGKIFYDSSDGPEPVVYKAYPGSTPQAQSVPDTDELEKGSYTAEPKPEGKYICGIQKTKFIVIICVFAAVVIGLAVGIGVSQGTKKSSTDTNTASSSSTTDNAKTTNNSPLQVLPNTGIASTPKAGGEGMLFYYQAPNGSVIEDFYAGNALTAQSVKASGPAAAQRSIVTTPNIAPKAPLAAVSYQLNGSDWRHLFYVNNGGTIMETKTSDDNWTQPERVFVNGIAPGGQCLAACFGPVEQGIGLRVIAGLSDRVMGTTSFLNQTGINGWIRGLVYSNSTNTAGCACTVDDKGKAPRLHVYTRNDTNAGNILHHMKQFPVGDWIQINEAAIRQAPNMAMDKQSSMAVTSSGNGTTNWVFYQGTDGRMKQFITNSQSTAGSSAFSSWDTRLVSGSKLGATWLDSSPEGPMVLYQTDAAQVRTSVVNWNAVALANDTLRS